MFRASTRAAQQRVHDGQRITTLWSLYRPLLKLAAPGSVVGSEQLKAHIRRTFRRSRKLQNEQRVQMKLDEGSKLLASLQAASNDNAYHQKQIKMLDEYLSAVDKSRAPPPPPPAPARRPTLTPGIIHATAYHMPLHRLKPQPLGLSMTIFNRRKAVQRRWDRLDQAKDWARDGQSEQRFEHTLNVDSSYNKAPGAWGDEWRATVKLMEESMTAERRRSEMRIPPAMQARANAAHRRRTNARGPQQRRGGGTPTKAASESRFASES